MPKIIQNSEPPMAKHEMRSAKSLARPSLIRAARTMETTAIINAGTGPKSIRPQRRVPPATIPVDAMKGTAMGESDTTAAIEVRIRTKLP